MMKSRRPTVVLVAFLGWAGFSAGADDGPARPLPHPHVIVFLSDDQGWGDFSYRGNRNLSTPNLDRLARTGTGFERFFVQPVCSPTRAEFLTGRYHPRGNVRDVTRGGERLDLGERTIADAFKGAGYATACFGKWHNGGQYPYHPLGRGFDEFVGYTSGHWAEYFDAPLDHNGADIRSRGYLPDDFTDRALEHLRRHHAERRPVFQLIAFNTPHSPMQVPDEDWARHAGKPLLSRGGPAENLDHTRAAMAMCENLDRNVGRVLAELDRLSAARDAIVVYFCDNGPNGDRWNGGMRGRKGTVDDGGTRSPLLIRDGRLAAQRTTTDRLAGAIDLLPTLLALAGVRRVGARTLDGLDLSAELKPASNTVSANNGGDSSVSPADDRILFQHWGGRVSARTARHRLDQAGRLYDMMADPGQTRPLPSSDPRHARLKQAVADWRRDVLKTPSADNRPYPAGYRELRRSVFPAGEGVPSGGVTRSSKHPNCSFFTHWTAPADAMTWSVETVTAGRYEAVVQYTCPKESAGVELELAFGSATFRGKLAEPWDPPLSGPERDRSPRDESPMKPFRRQSLGVLPLPAGTGPLTLRCPKPVAAAVADIRAVELIFLD